MSASARKLQPSPAELCELPPPRADEAEREVLS
jgi:hypothetical protein